MYMKLILFLGQIVEKLKSNLLKNFENTEKINN